MADRQATVTLSSEDHTHRFAEALADELRAGDTVLLSGDIGAGKTTIARTIIQHLQDIPEDVPSPTYTLVQTYETRKGALWHSDLYRITGPDEIEELGLSEAFATAICLVEWPDRLGPLAPDAALTLALTADPADPNIRHATLAWSDLRWDGPVAKLAQETIA